MSYRFASALASRLVGRVCGLVPLQGAHLGELLAAHVADVGFVARVAHAVPQQALGVGKALGAHLHTSRTSDQDYVPLFIVHA